MTTARDRAVCSLRSHHYETTTKRLSENGQEQLFGEALPRAGKLVLTKKALLKMNEWALSQEGLALTFQYGTKSKKAKNVYQVVREYKYYSIGLWYVEQYRPIKGTIKVEKVCLVITCWKGGVSA